MDVIALWRDELIDGIELSRVGAFPGQAQQPATTLFLSIGHLRAA